MDKETLTNYKEEATVLLKDAWINYRMEILLGICFIMFMGFMGNYASCWYPLSDDVWVLGNCEQLYEYKNRPLTAAEIMEHSEILKMNTNLPTITNMKIPEFNITPTENSQITREEPVCPTCKVCEPLPLPQMCKTEPCICDVCTKCPNCDFEPTPEQIDKALNYRQPSMSTAKQAGAMDAKDFYLELFDIPGRPKFRSRPSNYNPSLIYDSGTQDTGTFTFTIDENFCFYVNRTPDMNGLKRWSWNDEKCKSSNIQICHI